VKKGLVYHKSSVCNEIRDYKLRYSPVVRELNSNEIRKVIEFLDH
jgi:hypothetical protein